MAALNGEEVLVISSDKDNKISYVELSNGIKKWVNDSELTELLPNVSFENDSEIKVKKTKKEK
jgi:hypothetical protein